MRVFLIFLLFSAAASGEALHLGRSLSDWRAQLDSAVRIERLLAARAVGEMAIDGAEGAAEALAAAMGSNDSAVRYWSVVAAGQMGDRAAPALSRLRKALTDEAPEVRAWAAFAVARLGHGDEALPVLINVLENPEQGARLQAAHALDALGDKVRPAAKALVAALDDEFDYVQRVSRHALWELGERSCPYEECE